ncbi:restriction endonuclease subunit S [Aeromonas caviae]|uniref:restriction endonuclease subunit S n=1 Tax=Aeromonas caviae TaxID=648 RepID=UPI002B496E71|nr:restriction endonuclease subunit S [Aeromonas caviae]
MAELIMQNQVGEMAAKQTIPAGYKLTEVGVIPQDWNVSMLRDISSKITDGTHDTPKPVIEGIPFLTAIHVKDGKIDFDGCYFLPESIHNEIYRRCNPEFGDILMVNIGSGTATTAVVNVVYEFSLKNVALIKPNKENNGFYINYALSFSKNKIIDTILTGGAQPFLSLTQIALLQVPVPSREEQTTIANVLSDTDALIDVLEQLIAKKQAIKTATMQQLLTGRTRLPQFALRPDGTLKGYKSSELGQIPEDWEVKTLRDMLAESPKYGINAPAVELSRDTPAYIRITDINSDGYYRPTEKVGVRSVFSEQYILHVNDIVLARTGASVGKSYLYNVDDGPLVYAGFLIKVSPLQRILNSSYLFQFMKTKEYWDWVLVNSMRSGQPGINGAEFASMLIPTPSINEQTAIATILSDMDSELTALEQKLAKARDLKQGMMQQLLTGRIRLPLEVVA